MPIIDRSINDRIVPAVNVKSVDTMTQNPACKMSGIAAGRQAGSGCAADHKQDRRRRYIG